MLLSFCDKVAELSIQAHGRKYYILGPQEMSSQEAGAGPSAQNVLSSAKNRPRQQEAAQ